MWELKARWVGRTAIQHPPLVMSLVLELVARASKVLEQALDIEKARLDALKPPPLDPEIDEKNLKMARKAAAAMLRAAATLLEEA